MLLKFYSFFKGSTAITSGNYVTSVLAEEMPKRFL